MIQCVLEKRETGKRWSTWGEFDNSKKSRGFDKLAQTIYEIWFLRETDSQTAVSGAIDGEKKTGPSVPLSDGEKDFKQAFEVVAETMSPAQYKAAFIEHCVADGASRTVKKHPDLNINTVKGWIRKHRKQKRSQE